MFKYFHQFGHREMCLFEPFVEKVWRRLSWVALIQIRRQESYGLTAPSPVRPSLHKKQSNKKKKKKKTKEIVYRWLSQPLDGFRDIDQVSQLPLSVRFVSQRLLYFSKTKITIQTPWARLMGMNRPSKKKKKVNPVICSCRTHRVNVWVVATFTPTRVPDMTLNFIWWWGSSSGAWGNVEYPITALGW